MSRSTDYLRKPTERWATLKTELEENTFYLVQRLGPTVFSIRNDDRVLYKVVIGDPHKCSCGNGFGQECIHILFCLLKVLRIPSENHMSWQTGFTDTEIDIALARNFERRPNIVPTRRVKPSTAPTETQPDAAEGTVARQPLDGDECFCPICQDQMTMTQALSWCRKGCGNNIHAKCMKMFAQYKLESSVEVTCPLCREAWVSMEQLNEDCRSANFVKTCCARVTCSSCSVDMRGDFYRCIECSLTTHTNRQQQIPQQTSNIIVTDNGKVIKSAVDFCKNCFDSIGRVHATHHFINSDVNSVYQEFTWQSAINPRAPSTASKYPPELLASLQGRELTAADYDLLMALDEKKSRAPPLNELLITALSASQSMTKSAADPASCPPPMFCQYCKQPSPPEAVVVVPTDPVSIAIAEFNGVPAKITAEKQGNILRALPCCDSIVHSACIDNAIKQIMKKETVSTVEVGSSSDSMAEIAVGSGCLLDKLMCQNDCCGKTIFARLSRKKKKKLQANAISAGKASDNVVTRVAAGGSGLGLGFGVSGTAVFGQGNSEEVIPIDSSGAAAGDSTRPTRQNSTRSSIGRHTGSRGISSDINTVGVVVGRGNPSPSLLALNAMHMSMNGQTTAIATRNSGVGGSRKIAKGLSFSANSARREEVGAAPTRSDGIMSTNTAQAQNSSTVGIGLSTRVVSRQVGGLDRTKAVVNGQKKITRHSSFRGDIPPRDMSTENVDASGLVDLVVRSVTADSNARGAAAVESDDGRGVLGASSVNGNSSRVFGDLKTVTAGTSVKNKYMTGRVAKGSLVKTRRSRGKASDNNTSSSGGGVIQDPENVDLCLNVNHYS